MHIFFFLVYSIPTKNKMSTQAQNQLQDQLQDQLQGQGQLQNQQDEMNDITPNTNTNINTNTNKSPGSTRNYYKQDNHNVSWAQNSINFNHDDLQTPNSNLNSNINSNLDSNVTLNQEKKTYDLNYNDSNGSHYVYTKLLLQIQTPSCMSFDKICTWCKHVLQINLDINYIDRSPQISNCITKQYIKIFYNKRENNLDELINKCLEYKSSDIIFSLIK